MPAVYIRVWEYHVPTDSMPAFLDAYGAAGDWAQLFRRGTGYLGTQLYRDTDTADHFITVDRWTDESAWRNFLDAWADEYSTLDAALAGLGAIERALIETAARG